MSSDLVIQGEVVVNSEKAENAFDRVGDKATKMATEVAAQAGKAGQAVDGIGAGAEKGAEQFTRAESRISASIKRSTQELQLLGKTASEKLEFKINAQGLDSTKFTPLLDNLKAVEAQAVKAGVSATGSLDKIGISAKQTAAAMRGVPAQFTDIVTSLQGGQAPLTVLLQQGGQLKDMFGGVGNAVRALGGYIVGLVNPFTVAAAAIGAVGFAYYKGSQEVESFNKALILSGDIAGVTSGKLQVMAQRISTVTGTQGAAAEALAQFAQSGAVGANNMERFTAAALVFERTTGTAIEKTVEKFAELKKSPLEASLKLNESMNYLTESLYKQIKALDDQGRATEAADLAQKAFSDTLNSRGKEMEAKLGTIERSWIAVKDAIKGAGDQLLNIGRSGGLDSQIAAQRQLVAQLEKPGATTRRFGDLAAPVSQSDITAAKEALAILEESARIEGRRTENLGEQARIVQARAKFDKDGLQFLDNAAKREREITQARIEGLAAHASEEEIEKRIANIRAKLKDPKEAVQVDPFDAIIKGIYERTAASKLELEQDLKLTEGQKQSVKVLEDLRNGTLELTQAQAILLGKGLEQMLQYEKLDLAKQALIKSQKDFEVERDKEYAANVNEIAKINEKAQAIEDEVYLYGLSKEAIQSLTIARLEEKKAILEQISGSALAIEANAQEIQLIEAKIEAIKRLAKAQDAIDTKDAAAKAAKEAAAEWKRAANQIGGNITDALMRAFESGKGFAETLRDTVANMFKTLVLRPVVQAIVSPAVGLLAGGGSGGALAGQAGLPDIAGLSSLYDTFTGSFAKIGSSVAGFASEFGELLTLTTSGASKTFGKFLTGNAAGIGTFASYAGGALAGYGVGNAISGNKSALGDGNGNVAVLGGTALGAILGGPIGAAIGGTIGGLVNRAFGTGPKEYTDSGINGSFGVGQFSGSTYKDWKRDGGWFTNGSSGTEMGALDSKTQSGFGKAFAAIQTQSGDYATALGESAGKIAGYSKDIKLSLNGTAEQNAEAIKGLFQSIANDVAKTVLDPQYIREGEEASATLQRLATSLTAVNASFDLVGKTMLSASQSSANAASQLADMFGGLDKYQGAITSYFQRYFSDEERSAKLREQLQKQLADVGVGMPTTLQAYRDLVTAQDISTEAGRKTYAALISLSGAFADVTQAATDFALEISKSFTDIAKSITDLVDGISGQRKQTADSVSGLTSPSSISIGGIQTGIASALAGVIAPSSAELVAQIQRKISADSSIVSSSSVLNTTSDAAKRVSDSRTRLDTTSGAYQSISQELASTMAQLAVTIPGWTRQPDNPFQSSYYDANPEYARLQTRTQSLTQQQAFALTSYTAAQGDYNKVLADYGTIAAQNVAATNQYNAALAERTAAENGIKDAQVKYNNELRAYVLTASTGLEKLAALREKTLEYYQQQKAISDLMATSASNLRQVMKDTAFGALSPDRQQGALADEFSAVLAKANASSGSGLAGYADQLGTLLPKLAESLMGSASSAAEYALSVGRANAQADGIAAKLEAQVSAADYLSETVDLLNSIDEQMAILESSAKSAQALIVAAVDAGAARTADGLQQVINALQGKSVAAFAGGGSFGGGVRLVGENGPELEATGPSRIWSASQTSDMLRGGGNAMAEELRKLREDLRIAQSATVALLARVAKTQEKWDGDGMPSVRSETA